MVLDASAFWDCWPLWATVLWGTVLSIPFVSISVLGQQFQSSNDEASHSQKQLSQVRYLTSAISKAVECGFSLLS